MPAGSSRKRLDEIVVERGLIETRARAQAVIIGGGVTVDGVVQTKPGHKLPEDSEVALVHEPLPYVSRGALKLKHALEVFPIDVAGKIAADIGASTGGFTEVLLEAGAARVYAIDVGYGQIAWKLRQDARVVVMDRTNIRHLESLPEPVDLAVIDTSFISLRTVLPAARRLLQLNGAAIALIKPQFEAGRERVGKGGVVRDPGVWRDVLQAVLGFARETGWAVRGLSASPIRGPAGNVEFLVYLGMAGPSTDIYGAVEAALASL